MDCPYCSTPAKHVDSSIIYGVSYGMAYVCGRFPACDAYVGCHKGEPGKALGTMANAELRTWRKKAHAAFDPIWKSGRMRRTDAYAWLSSQLGIPKDDTHIALFDVDLCQRTITAVELRSC